MKQKKSPPWSLISLMLLTLLCDAPRSQKDLAKLARRLTQVRQSASVVSRK